MGRSVIRIEDKDVVDPKRYNWQCKGRNITCRPVGLFKNILKRHLNFVLENIASKSRSEKPISAWIRS